MENLLAPRPIDDGQNLPDSWKIFKRDFEQFLVATSKDKVDSKIKTALLLRTIGKRGNLIYESFTWAEDGDKVKYNKVIQQFDNYCKPRINLIARTHALLTCKQGNQTVDEFITELHTIASLCDFQDMYNRMVLHALILGIENDKTRRKLFEQNDADLDKAVELCRREESTSKDFKKLTGHSKEEQAYAVRHRPPFPNNSTRGNRNPHTNRTASNPPETDSNHESKCGNCGQSHPPRSCPAYGKQCNNCKKYNHYATVCRSKTTQVANQLSWNYSSDSEGEQVYSITTTERNRKLLANISVQIGNKAVPIEFQLDSAASCNTLTMTDYDRLGKPNLTPTNTTLTLYDQSKCIPLGWTDLMVENQSGQYTSRKFLVVDTKQHSLLSWKTCQQLELLKLGEQVNATSTSDDQIDNLLDEFVDVFTGLGKLDGLYDIELDPNCRPVQVRPRKVPLSMKEDLIAAIDKLEERGIVAKVDHPTDWISHLQPVRKPNGKIRVCIDPQNLNRAIKRNHSVLPTLEDVLPQLNNARFFSLCDAKEGFYQIPLTDSSTDLTTFWTPTGKYKYLRMPFGIASAPEEFQRRLTEGLTGLNGVTVVADDLLIYGTTRQQHDINLRALLERARKIGLKLNKDKCRFLQKELPYIGHLLTTDGIKPDPNKVTAIREMQPPTTQLGVKRFLGHVTYMAKFVKNLAAESEPLRRLLKQGNSFSWDTDQKASFDKLKTILTDSDTLQYFDVTKPVVLQTDASTAGIGAALFQEGKPIAYASRSLTMCEQQYVPLELECLAIVYGTERFDQYIFGHFDVTIHTDHQPLISIFNKSIHKASRRLQAMLLQLQRYPKVKVVWKKGTEQITADLLSRDSYFGKPTHHQPLEHLFAINVADNDNPIQDPLLKEVASATKEDSESQHLIKLIRSGWSKKHADQPTYDKYRHFNDELTIEQDIIYKGQRAVIPKALQRKTLNLLHANHAGINSTLRRARLTVFWVGMSDDIKRLIETCNTCQIDHPQQQRETLQSHHIPQAPWTKVGVDLFDFSNEQYLVIVDYTTDYFEFEKLSNSSAEEVIHKLKKCFARLGIPNIVQSDNGPQFTSHMFATFRKEWQFEHTTSSPHFPQSNGKAESAVKIAKRNLRRCKDSELGMLELRNTPTASMDKSPIQLLLGRSTRSILPQTTAVQTTNTEAWQQKQTKKRKDQHQYNKRARNLAPLNEGQPVLVRDWTTHRRNWKEAVVAKQLSDRSYAVNVNNDMLRRNRRDLQPRNVEVTDNPEPPRNNPVENEPPNENPNPADAQQPRRSHRVRNPPSWLNDFVTQ